MVFQFNFDLWRGMLCLFSKAKWWVSVQWIHQFIGPTGPNTGNLSSPPWYSLKSIVWVIHKLPDSTLCSWCLSLLVVSERVANYCIWDVMDLIQSRRPWNVLASANLNLSSLTCFFVYICSMYLESMEKYLLQMKHLQIMRGYARGNHQSHKKFNYVPLTCNLLEGSCFFPKFNKIPVFAYCSSTYIIKRSRC